MRYARGTEADERVGVISARAGVLIACRALVAVLLLIAPVAHAQELDVEPPLIEHERIERGEQGVAQEFTATVVDDREVEEVLLFHRRAGDETFENLPLERVGTSSVFLATLPTEAGDARAIEYYIQARDASGNRVIRGYAFNPLQRLMVGEGAGPLAEADAAQTGVRKRWLWIGLGVLAVGAAVALSDSGDGESSDTFTVTIEPPG